MERLSEEGADMVTFTSSSTAKYFHELGLPWPEGCVAASIGPITTAKLKDLGRKDLVEAQNHSIEGIVAAIVEQLVDS